MATATAASRTETSEARFRKRPARSIEERICGAVGDPAAGLDQLGGFQVGLVDEQGRGQVDEAPALVRPEIQYASQLQNRPADFYRNSCIGAETRQQARGCPGFSRTRYFTGLMDLAEQVVRCLQPPAKGVSLRHSANGGQGVGFAGEYHAWHAADSGGGEARLACQFFVCSVDGFG
jgi:hypothetical protein